MLRFIVLIMNAAADVFHFQKKLHSAVFLELGVLWDVYENVQLCMSLASEHLQIFQRKTVTYVDKPLLKCYDSVASGHVRSSGVSGHSRFIAVSVLRHLAVQVFES